MPGGSAVKGFGTRANEARSKFHLGQAVSSEISPIIQEEAEGFIKRQRTGVTIPSATVNKIVVDINEKDNHPRWNKRSR